MMLALLLFLVAPFTCKATTDVPEFKEQVHRACGERIKSVSIVGDHEHIVYTITYALDLRGQQIAETVLAQQAWQSAVTSHTVLNRSYPMKSFDYYIKDVEGRDVCVFRFEGDEEKPWKGTCMDYVR